MKSIILGMVAILALSGCATITAPPQWSYFDSSMENEYQPYMIDGPATITGQAFMAQAGGGVVKAAGRTVTIDPATTIGTEWWQKAGKDFSQKTQVPPSQNFLNARRETTANADGQFKFSNIPNGKYYVRTEVTWEVGGYYPTQGGLVGKIVEVKNGKTIDIILNQFPE